MKTAGYAALDDKNFAPFQFEVRDLTPKDVHIEILYCGICHSDVHNVRNDFNVANYPMVPGHEIAGVVKAVGDGVTKFKVGDRVGVGCLVDSCRTCDSCKKDQEPQCSDRTPTYNKKFADGTTSKGGYARDIIVNEHFVISIPGNIELEKAGPLMCAGITTYSAMKFYGMDKIGKKVGVIGLGGLGHVAVQISKAFGNEVYVISHSEKKRGDSEKLKVNGFVNVSNKEQLESFKNKFDFLLDTTTTVNMRQNLSLLRVDGTVVMVGLAKGQYEVPPSDLVFNRKSIGGSLIGGLKETQEMIDFCSLNNIAPWTELISMDKIEEAYDRIEKSDVRYRFVIDVKNTAPKVEC